MKAASDNQIPRGQACRITRQRLPLLGKQNSLNNAKSSVGSPAKKSDTKDIKLREAVLAEVLDTRPSIRWVDIAGLGNAKQVRPAL